MHVIQRRLWLRIQKGNAPPARVNLRMWYRLNKFFRFTFISTGSCIMINQDFLNLAGAVW